MDKRISNYIEKINADGGRTKVGITTSVIGLLSNFILFLIKFFAGILSGSVSIITDSMNNLGDSASSLVSLFGFHLAAKPADKEHPYGHERFEYISGLLIAVIIIFVGFQFFLTSIEQILNPTPIAISGIVSLLLVVSIIAKLFQGRFFSVASKTICSTTLDSVAKDSFNDTWITILVLISAIVESISGWHIDGYVGGLLSILIVYGGAQAILESFDELLGARPSIEELRQMKELLDQYDEIVGYHDLLVHNYGPSRTFATIHIEIDDSWSLTRSHRLIDKIEEEFANQLDVELVCHVDPIAIQSEKDTAIQRQLKAIIKSVDRELRFHDFKVELIELQPTILFDLVIPSHFTQTNQELENEIIVQIHEQIGRNYNVNIVFDRLDLLEEL